jgi:hypothetical protein
MRVQLLRPTVFQNESALSASITHMVQWTWIPTLSLINAHLLWAPAAALLAQAQAGEVNLSQ